MSGPNSSYDPVQVTPLGEEQVFAMRDAALAAIAATATAARAGGSWLSVAERGSILGVRVMVWCYRLAGQRFCQFVMLPVVL